MPFPTAPSSSNDATRASIHTNQDTKQLAASCNDQDDNQNLENHYRPEVETPEAADNDAHSIISDRDEIFSQVPARRSHQELLAERHLTLLLAQHQDLTPLYDIALERMEREHFVDNFRKILKRYYLDLVQSASTNLEHATIHLLRSRWRRVRIAQDIVDQASPKSNEINDYLVGDMQEAEAKMLELESWIAGNPGLAPPAEPHNIRGEVEVKADDFDDAVSDRDSEEEENIKDYLSPNVVEMEKFLLEGNSFHLLVTNICLFLLPASLTSLSRVLMTVPYNDIYFSSEEYISVLNRVKGFLEDHTEENWNWWPLQPRVRPLARGQTRVYWTCHCGSTQWADISLSQAESYRLILQRNRSTFQNNHLCRARRKTSWRAAFKGAVAKMTSPVSARTQRSELQGIIQPARLQNVQLRPSGGRIQQSIHISHNPAGSATINQNGVRVDIGELAGADLYVLFGVKGPRRTLELEQIKIKEYSNDNAFFQCLTQAYKKHRGFWRYWLSIWQLAYCDFVKFQKLRANRIIHHSKSLPEDIVYEYRPRPPTAENPPIVPHEFELAFSACSSKCSLSALHDCVEPPLGTFAIERIPKRKGLIEINGDNPEFAWGIQAQHAISFFRILMYHLLIFAGTFAFWACWLVTHPNDLQNAAVPLTTVAVLLSLFWSSAGLLKAFREQH
ncbi:hypothetical protein BKA61DRAFT_497437 [Leptodontidium sp. MPI-SDFR-AT-0119]|nr:hypothetical protein BKA61DRAFT_497437 [Leptodontidium sp. MPI-SDFR-AT-0119]